MRIIAGRLGGRQFDSPKTHKTHPMSDKMRGALFNMLGELQGLTVLDAFAGSGALSFEAISRGALSALAIESDRQAQNVVAANIKELRLGKMVKLIRATANAWLSTSDDSFDIIICDPPYDDLQVNLLTKLADRVNSNGLVIYSLPPDADFGLDALTHDLIMKKSYGDSGLVFYRKKS